MKIKLTFLSLFFVVNSMASVCCPVWLVGKLYVVDENNRPVNVKVWRHYSDKDSSLQPKRRYWYGEAETKDTNAYEFWNGGFTGSLNYMDKSTSNRYLRIQAEGYTDVIIRNLKFIDNEKSGINKLVIKMYARKYIKTGDRITLIQQFECDKIIVETDSMVVDIKFYEKTIKNAREASLLSNSSLLSVESYPNPVTDYLVVKINSEIKEPYQFKLLDAEGKLISQSKILVNISNVDLQWISKGRYILMVYDPKGNPVLSRTFLKI